MSRELPKVVLFMIWSKFCDTPLLKDERSRIFVWGFVTSVAFVEFSNMLSKGRVHKKTPEKVWSFAKPGGR